MRAVKGKGTRIERSLWSMLAGMRLANWKKNPSGFTGNPDVVFPDVQVAIFVDGCFWHKCPSCQRKLPKANHDYWENKLNRNVERSAAYDKALTDTGWRVIHVWEHELKNARARSIPRERIRTAILKGYSDE